MRDCLAGTEIVSTLNGCKEKVGSTLEPCKRASMSTRQVASHGLESAWRTVMSTLRRWTVLSGGTSHCLKYLKGTVPQAQEFGDSSTLEMSIQVIVDFQALPCSRMTRC